MLPLSGTAFHRVSPQLADEGARTLVTLFKEGDADQRLHDIAQDVVAVVPAIVAGLLAEHDVFAKPDRARDFCAG